MMRKPTTLDRGFEDFLLTRGDVHRRTTAPQNSANTCDAAKPAHVSGEMRCGGS